MRWNGQGEAEDRQHFENPGRDDRIACRCGLSRGTLRLMKAPDRDTLRDFWNRWMARGSRNQTS